MIFRWTKGLLTAAALALGGPALAQDESVTSAANSTVPAEIPTSAFAARSPFTDVPHLSPDGKRIAYSFDNNGAAWLGVISTESGHIDYSIPLPVDYELRWYSWAGNDRLLLSVNMPMRTSWGEGRVARLMVQDLIRHEIFFVGPKSQGRYGDDVIYTDPEGQFILLSTRPDMIREPEVWRFPLDVVDDPGVKVESKRGIMQWIADDAGVVRVGLGYENRKVKVWYRKQPGDELKLIARIRPDAEEDRDEIWDVARIIEGSDQGLVFEPGESGRLALRRFNYATREIGEVVYENPEWDLTAVSLDEDGTPLAVHFTDDRDNVVWLDSGMARLQTQLQQALGGPDVHVVERARDGSRMLISTGGASNPGAWYVYFADTRELKEFSPVRPDIDPAMLAAVRAVTYSARDGTAIRAYLTLPKGREAKSLPLIILPHGGPYGVRDKLSYSDEVQLLANRGYAVLQPNYRGSDGFGEAFEEQGKGEIGRKMQDDLDDAMDWAVGEGIADPARVCLVGSSYGGYAALWGVIRNPERYRCAASFAGVTEWDKMLSYNRNFLSRQGRRKLRDLIQGEERTFDLDTVSPARRARDLTRPVLLAHGRKDSTVPFTQFRGMRNALQQAGTPQVQYLELEEAGHGFSRTEDEQAWYDALIGFLARHNPADAPPVGTGG
jgi:dipeptidyl aminopeptidase/acylaminoacyl peptidase